jgi:TonB-dependent receptor
MQKTVSFKKTIIASAIASIAGFSSMAFAQDEGEEIVITGIKASLARAMDIKREAKGVVEAISAEDIGKMPDTNLAESLQRISGISIDRSNNEGSKITARGFGPDFNLVTLNGRQMPTNGFSRSFEFSDVAAESVSGVEVYKTFSANKATGGIGALVNIKTARPLDNPGLKVSVGAKAIVDTTNVVGQDATPAISGIFSNTFADDTFGVALIGSYQERDSREVSASIANWRNNIDFNKAGQATVIDNRADKTGNIYYPRNYGYGIEDISKDRTNGQLVLQYKPTDSIKTTLDYTYVKTNLTGLSDGVGIWFGDSGSDSRNVTIDENGTVTKLTAAGDDYASNIRLNTSETENKSVGFNVEWEASDNLTLNFDAHNSIGENGGVGRGDGAFLILAAPSIAFKTYDATAKNDIPDMGVTFVPAGIVDGKPVGVGIVNGQPTAASYDSLFGQAGTNRNKSEVNQYQLNGTFAVNEDEGVTSLDFGAGNTSIENRWRSYNTGQIPAGWYGGNQGLFPDDIFTEHQLNGLTPSFSGGKSTVPVYHSWDFEKAVQILENGKWATPEMWVWGSGPTNCKPCVMRNDLNGDPVTDHSVIEDTASVYLQANSKGDFAGMELKISTGLRYEATTIEASSFQKDPTELVWVGPTEWSRNQAAASSYTNETGKYNVWLPSFDASLNITDDVVTRLSYSKSITRPSLGSMIGTFSVTDRPKPGERTGTAGNPDLKPYSSNNFDLSAEWYYDDASYVSGGFFVKQVNDFIVNKITEREVGNLRDPAAVTAPRRMAAVAKLVAAGKATSDANILEQMRTDSGLATTAPIVQNDTDPKAKFNITQPINLEETQLYGVELAIQHMFGESGFGVQANATIIKGDLEVDNASTDFQFNIPGMSDSLNLVGFYEKHGIQARLAYNWRDTFLNGVGEGNAPQYTEAYGQLDMNISYELPMVEGLTVFVEGINLTDSSQRTYARYENQFKSASQYGARYTLGARYSF